MLANLHHSLQGKDIGPEEANIITRVLLNQIEEKEKRFSPQDKQWEADVIASLRLCKGIEEGSRTAQAYLLAVIKRNWDNLSYELRKNYDFQFSVLVMRETGVLPDTMENYIRTAETFFVKGIKPTGLVEVSKYDAYGNPVKQEGEVVKEWVEFDPTKVTISKLMLARPLAESGQMTIQTWSLLADSKVTTETFKREIYNSSAGEGNTKSDPSLKFTLDGDRIVATEFGISTEIGEIYFDLADSDVGRNALKRLLLVLGIKYDEDEIAKRVEEAHQRQIIRTYNNGGYLLVPEE